MLNLIILHRSFFVLQNKNRGYSNKNLFNLGKKFNNKPLVHLKSNVNSDLLVKNNVLHPKFYKKTYKHSLVYEILDLPFSFDNDDYLEYRLQLFITNYYFDKDKKNYFIIGDFGTKSRYNIPMQKSWRFLSLSRNNYSSLFYNKDNLHLIMPSLLMGNSTTVNFQTQVYNTNFQMDSCSLNISNINEDLLINRLNYYKQNNPSYFNIDSFLSILNDDNNSIQLSKAPMANLQLTLSSTRYLTFFINSFTKKKALFNTSRFFRYVYNFNIRKHF